MVVCNIRACWFNHLVSVATVCSGPRSLETLLFVPFFTHNSMMCNKESSTHQLSNEPKTSKPINDTAPQTKTGLISRFLNQKTIPAIKTKDSNPINDRSFHRLPGRSILRFPSRGDSPRIQRQETTSPNSEPKVAKETGGFSMEFLTRYVWFEAGWEPGSGGWFGRFKTGDIFCRSCCRKWESLEHPFLEMFVGDFFWVFIQSICSAWWFF